MTLKQAAQQALDIQDACNLSGVAFAFARAMQAVCDESHGQGRGTDWRNTHPIVTMHLLKMAELNGCGSTLHESYDKAEAECKAIAAGPDVAEYSDNCGRCGLPREQHKNPRYSCAYLAPAPSSQEQPSTPNLPLEGGR